MKFIKKGEVGLQRVQADRDGVPAKGTFKQVLIEGPNFDLRVFTVKPDGRTPQHRHSWEHEVYVLSGNGKAVGAEEFDISEGDAVLVPPGEPHFFANAGKQDLRFICVVPKEGG